MCRLVTFRLVLFRLILLALLSAGTFASREARAGFRVSPVTMTLSASVTSGLLTITNQSTDAIRFHVTAFVWDEGPDGEMLLNPTTDVIFFPAMMSLNANEARKLRVGLNVAPGGTERSYRLFVQELPPLVQRPEDQPSAVRVLTRMGIPIFVQGIAPKAAPVVDALAVHGDAATFLIRNTGNAHFLAGKIVVTAKDGPKVVHTQELQGWYVLAGGTRKYTVTLPQAACQALKSIQVELETEKGSVQAVLDSAHCGP